MSASINDKGANKETNLTPNSVPDKKFYQINTNGVDIITERSAISKSISNTNGINNYDYA
jgi:hypothetical protein